MTDREKLIELIGGTHYGKDNGSTIGRNFQSGFIEKIADHLLSHGVTFAKDTDVPSKWISVEDRLPEKDGSYVTATNATGETKGVMVQNYKTACVRGKELRRWVWHDRLSPWRITHWMPLPQPPREE